MHRIQVLQKGNDDQSPWITPVPPVQAGRTRKSFESVLSNTPGDAFELGTEDKCSEPDIEVSFLKPWKK